MIKQHLLCLLYKTKLECIIDKDSFPLCKTTPWAGRNNMNRNAPSYEYYIPRANTVIYKCTMINCEPYKLFSMTQLSNPSNLKRCHPETSNKYTCEPLEYNNLKTIDKLLFLSNNIPNNKFYLADCLVYADGERVCHKKDNVDSHAKLIDIGTILRPNDKNILSQDELLCEETGDGKIRCNFNGYVPISNVIKQKELVNIGTILLKSGSYIVPLELKCQYNWCGYTGEIQATRRGITRRSHYEPPGGSVYRCYYAKRQQVCKKLYGPYRQVYNERAWLRT